jgi:hypothetical protein
VIPFRTLTEERPAKQPLGLRADFPLYCVRFRLLDENIRRSNSCIGDIFPARHETVAVPESQNDSSQDD